MIRLSESSPAAERRVDAFPRREVQLQHGRVRPHMLADVGHARERLVPPGDDRDPRRHEGRCEQAEHGRDPVQQRLRRSLERRGHPRQQEDEREVGDAAAHEQSRPDAVRPRDRDGGAREAQQQHARAAPLVAAAHHRHARDAAADSRTAAPSIFSSGMSATVSE